MAFVVKRKIELAAMGDEWKDCYIVFNSPTTAQIGKLEVGNDDIPNEEKLQRSVGLITELFIEGKGYNGTEVQSINTKDIPDLPLLLLNYCFEQLASSISPKSEES